MRTYTQEEIKAMRANLPQDLKDALSSLELMEELRRIVTEKHLHVDEAGDVAETVELTLSGLVKASEFVSRLRELLPSKSEVEVSALAEEINRRIFIKIHDSLKSVDYVASGVRESVVVNDTLGTKIPTLIPVAPTTLAPQSISSILEAKSLVPTETNHATSENTHENSDQRLKLVPDDLRQKINSDPYKESI